MFDAAVAQLVATVHAAGVIAWAALLVVVVMVALATRGRRLVGRVGPWIVLCVPLGIGALLLYSARSVRLDKDHVGRLGTSVINEEGLDTYRAGALQAVQASDQSIFVGTKQKVEASMTGTHLAVRYEMTRQNWIRILVIVCVGGMVAASALQWRSVVARPRVYAAACCAVALLFVSGALWQSLEVSMVVTARDVDAFANQAVEPR